MRIVASPEFFVIFVCITDGCGSGGQVVIEPGPPGPPTPAPRPVPGVPGPPAAGGSGGEDPADRTPPPFNFSLITGKKALYVDLCNIDHLHM